MVRTVSFFRFFILTHVALRAGQEDDDEVTIPSHAL